MNVSHTITITDDRDGCTYTRDYINSADWSHDVHDMLGIVLPGVVPHFADLRNSYGGGEASGPLFDADGVIVGRYESKDLGTK
ncbi:hypothetical protein A5747_13415 [Mycobacterium sp. IS-836]|uniref:hypothetical protein n=1 Tax=Mycobacterium sp. IS-836 TaxID=1834160 RepID=UPI00096F5170|nr:hypothetical protein [Mycobacterium sp. IS-836]OMC55386.1 hypothetical protein A5747_13415 [Mycobacterium sp. IS-836]